jgi:hypothetical protein
MEISMGTAATAAQSRMQYRGLRGWLDEVDVVQNDHTRMQEMKPPPRFLNDGPIFENVVEGEACIPYDKKLKGTFPTMADVSAALRKQLRAEFPKPFPAQ